MNHTRHLNHSGNFKIAVVRALYLGDLLCIIPTIRAVRHAFPDASITLIGLPWEKYFVERFYTYFDAFVEFPGWPDLPEQRATPDAIISFLQTMQAQKFDLLLQMQGNGASTNAMCMLFGAKKVCGLRKPDEYMPDEKLFPVSEDHEHEIRRFLKLIDVLNIPRQGEALEFPITPDEAHAAQAMLEAMHLTPGRFVCVHPGARDPKRRWAPAYFAYIADQLVARGYAVLLTGSQEEASLLQAVEDCMQMPATNLVSRFGQVGIGELGFMLTQSAALLANDTGLSHVAAALEVPSVIVFSRFSASSRWAPLNSGLHTIVTPRKSDNLDDICRAVFEKTSVPVGA